ncbi:MAG TPA: C4-type zinc ribbon domain-containing protein [Candidatus Binataceae bacterium]|nr:C4-type zinc ribbon domain-containing protein [Candidatus Binataceae bacterium]
MSLQAIDRELRELEGSLSSIAGRIDQLRREVDAHQSELDRLQQEEEESGVNRRRLEKELAEGEARIRNKRMRLNQARNDKELQALGIEVDTLKENNQRLEAELLAAMEAAEARGPRIVTLRGTLDEKRKELETAEKEIAAQLEDLKVSIAKQRADRDLMARDIPASLLQRYEVIFSKRAGLAVAEAKGGTCQGCRMRLPPQLYNELQKHLQIHFCPACQRILYFESATERE